MNNEQLQFKQKVEEILSNIEYVLLEKNKKYGNSALNPGKIFSNLNGEEGIKIRIDDKLKRIQNSEGLRKNDIFDLMGYLILLSISKEYNFEDLID